MVSRARVGVPGATDRTGTVLLGLSRVVLAATVRAGSQLSPTLSPTQIRTLSVLSAAPDGVSLTVVAQQLGTGLPSTSRIVQRLVRDGLVDRLAGPGNELRLSLSEQGVGVLTEVNRARLVPLRSVLDGLPASSRRAVVSALGVLLDAAEQSPDTW